MRRSRAAINSLQQKSSMISVPKAPKKPPNAYIAFAAAAREGIILKNPGISFTDVAKRLGAEWKGLNTRQREASAIIFILNLTHFQKWCDIE